MVDWREYTNYVLPFNSSDRTQYKTKARKAPNDEGQGAYAHRRVRHVWTMSKVGKSEGVQGPQSSRLVTGNDLNNVRFQKNSSGMSYYRSLCAAFLYIFLRYKSLESLD